MGGRLVMSVVRLPKCTPLLVVAEFDFHQVSLAVSVSQQGSLSLTLFLCITSLNTDFNITYGSGAASGTLAQDTVTMAGYTVSDQKFGAVNQVTQGLLTQPYSGLIGLAFQTIASSGAMPFWQQLAVTNQLPEPLMAFFLRRYRDDFSASAIEYDGGEFSLGYTNSSLYVGDINYISIPTQNEDYWRIAVQGLNVESQAVSIVSRGSFAWFLSFVHPLTLSAYRPAPPETLLKLLSTPVQP
jgi:hypothetical protein